MVVLILLLKLTEPLRESRKWCMIQSLVSLAGACDMVEISAFSKVVNPRRACAARVTVVGLCVCVCLSVKSHLTYGAPVRPENAVTY